MMLEVKYYLIYENHYGVEIGTNGEVNDSDMDGWTFGVSGWYREENELSSVEVSMGINRFIII